MIGVSLAATLGIIAFLSARFEGARAGLNGLTLFLVVVVALILSKQLGVDWKALFLGLSTSYSTLAMALVTAVSLGALAGLYARWSSRWNLTPPRVGLVVFVTSLTVFNIGTLLLRLKEAS